MTLEEAFGLTLPTKFENDDPVYKALFTRADFCLRDLAEALYVTQEKQAELRGGGVARRRRRDALPAVPSPSPARVLPFTQLGGRLDPAELRRGGLFETILPPRPRPRLFRAQLVDQPGQATLLRRRTDGMLCAAIPAADAVIIGSDRPHASPDERPAHAVRVSPFLIDIEPVSTCAYARFLNSIAG